MTDYERHAALLLAEGRPSRVEVASILGAHEFRVRPAGRSRLGRTGGPWNVCTLSDARTGEPIAVMTYRELEELADWLETERPLEARPVRYTVVPIRDRQYAIGSSSVDGGCVDEPVDRAPPLAGTRGRLGGAFHVHEPFEYELPRGALRENAFAQPWLRDPPSYEFTCAELQPGADYARISFGELLAEALARQARQARK